MAKAELEGEEAVLVEILKQHPEYFDIWERADTLLPDEQVLLDGVNPFVHVMVHQTVENQIADRTPTQTAETLEALVRAGYSRHDAIGTIVAQEMFEIMQDDRPFEETGHVKALRDLARTAKRPGKRRRPRRKKR